MMRIFILMLSMLLVAGLLPVAESMAAINSIRDSVSPEKTWNPQPAKDDIHLPMPCGLSMVLRAVSIPARTLLQDRRFSMGIGAAGDATRKIYERRFPAYIAASFTAADLPPEWRARIPAQEGYMYYFMGKYELSEYQWSAVMDGQCPANPPAGANQPKRGISWHDAQRFLQTYNAWLLKKFPDSLPHFANNTRNVGFLRLPTEEEWEFAARGGGNVRTEDLIQNDIFPLGTDKLSDYGLFKESVPVHKPTHIGMRKANPLGLYDTVGNVKELVDGFFRLSVADKDAGPTRRRLHGATGGVLCKGGSFRSDAQGVLPGWRDEIPQYTSEGENRPDDLGFRVVLAGLNIPSGERLTTLVKEECTREEEEIHQTPVPPSGDKVIINPEGTPLSELDKIISEAVANKEIHSNLIQLRAIVENEQAAEQRQYLDRQENALRALLYQAETLRSFAYRYHTADLGLQRYLKKKGTLGEDNASRNARTTLRSNYELILTAANYYKTCLSGLLIVPINDIRQILTFLRQEYNSSDMLGQHMQQNINALEKHLKIGQGKGIDALSSKGICRDIIPDIHFKVLPF